MSAVDNFNIEQVAQTYCYDLFIIFASKIYDYQNVEGLETCFLLGQVFSAHPQPSTYKVAQLFHIQCQE